MQKPRSELLEGMVGECRVSQCYMRLDARKVQYCSVLTPETNDLCPFSDDDYSIMHDRDEMAGLYLRCFCTNAPLEGRVR